MSCSLWHCDCNVYQSTENQQVQYISCLHRNYLTTVWHLELGIAVIECKMLQKGVCSQTHQCLILVLTCFEMSEIDWRAYNLHPHIKSDRQVYFNFSFALVVLEFRLEFTRKILMHNICDFETTMWTLFNISLLKRDRSTTGL